MSSEPSSTKREQIQSAVLVATEELLAEGVPFAELNIERIATRAGISRTAFYFYFKDKRELLMRLTEDVTDTLYRSGDVWFSGSGDPESELRDALKGIATLYLEHRTLLGAIVEVSTYDEQIATFWRGLVQRFADATARRIAAEQEAGRAPQFDPGPVAFALVWMVERTLYQMLAQDRGIDETLDALVVVWVRTING